MALLLAAGAAAQSRSTEAGSDTLRVLTPAEARVDRDGDGVPDRVGERVAVGGRASVSTRGVETFNSAIETAGAGLILLGGPVTSVVTPGDSVVAVGVVTARNGTTSIAIDRYRLVEGPRRVPQAIRIGPKDPLEPYEGRLVEVEGRALLHGRLPLGSTLALSHGNALLYALAFGDAEGAIFQHVAIGQGVRIRGVLGQFDREAPYTDGYQVYPDGPADVDAVGLAPGTWRRLTALAALLLAASFVGLLVLQRRSRRREQAQALSDRRYRLLFESSPHPVLVAELTPRGPVLIDCNDEATRMLKRPREAFIGQVMWDVAFDPGPVRALHEALLKHSEARGRYQGAHDRRFDVEANLLREGAAAYALVVMRDVTQAEAYERELVRAREEAEAYARLQASFVANMSHEIRTPLAGIIGFAEILREELDGQQRHFAEIIEGGGRRLLDTLSTILDLARLTAGEAVAPRTPCSISGVVTGAVDLLRPLAGQKGVALAVDLAPLSGFCNGDALERIVYNLVGNALKFTPKGGRVAVSLAAAGPEGARLVVADTGVGMEPAFLERLYTPFRQAETGLSRGHEGAGLGLSITHRLVALLGGRIEVVSEVGVGTTFTVTVPVGADAPGADAAVEPAAAEEVPGHPFPVAPVPAAAPPPTAPS